MQRLRSDADYRENQARAQTSWRARHPDYWRQYRAAHPAYRERNCAMQRKRNTQRRSSPVANMDASQPLHPLASGFYILRRAAHGGIAKMEREMSNLQAQYKLVEQTYGQDVLNLVLAKGYLVKLLENELVKQYLRQRQPDLLSEFEAIVETGSLEQQCLDAAT